MFWCDSDLDFDNRRKRNARGKWRAFVPCAAEGKGSRGKGGFHGEPELINGLIKKSNQLCEAYTVCHSAVPSPRIVLLL